MSREDFRIPSEELDAHMGYDAVMAKRKVHHRYGCRNQSYYARLCKSVTCKKCLKVLKELGFIPRIET